MSNEMPFFSVVIPTYNSTKTIRIPLESLKKQTFRSFEVVIVDDCSGDYEELCRIVESYKNDLDIIIRRHESNLNGAAARNTGISLAKASYIAFLDSDDMWHEEKLDIVKHIIESGAMDARTILYGRFNLYRGDRFMGRVPSRPIGRHESVGDYLFAFNEKMQTSTIVCSRETAEQVKFDVRFTRHQDCTFMIQAQARGYQFYFIDKPLSSYIFPANGLTSRIQHSRINSSYCDYWTREMKGYLSSAALNGYRFYVKAAVLGLEGNRVAGAILRLRSWLKFSFKMHASLASYAAKRFYFKYLRR